MFSHLVFVFNHTPLAPFLNTVAVGIAVISRYLNRKVPALGIFLMRPPPPSAFSEHFLPV